jgi:hypothetical protein
MKAVYCATLPLIATAVFLQTIPLTALGQETATPNGISDRRANAYAFTNATIYRGQGEFLTQGSLLIRDGLVVEVSGDTTVPAGYFEIDLNGDYIYPGFIDAYTEYGVPELEREQRNTGAENLFSSGYASNANDAVKADFRASTEFRPDEDSRGKFRGLGFSTVLSLRADGVARGTSALVTLGAENANESVICPMWPPSSAYPKEPQLSWFLTH